MSAERKLFLSLWGILLLVFLLWRFWPQTGLLGESDVLVELAPELRTWFETPRAIAQPSHLRIELALKPEFARGVQTLRVAQLGYGLRGPNGMLFQSSIECPLEPGKAATTVSLPNPKRVTARSVYLYLAR